MMIRAASPPGYGARLRALALLFAWSALLTAGPPAPLHAQPSGPGFDLRTLIHLDNEASVQARGDFNGDGVPDIAVAGPGHLTMLVQKANSLDWKIVHGAATKRTPLMAASGRLDGDSRDDLVLLCGPRPVTLEIHITGASLLPVPTSSIELAEDVQQVSVADVNGDHNADLLLYGKKTTGILVYTGNGKGRFTREAVLFPDISVSRAVVAHVDDNDQIDIAVVDWIGNTVRIFPGFGKLYFGDPHVLAFDQEPTALAVGDMNGDKLRDLVVGFGDEPGFAVYAGDGSGYFSEFDRGALAGRPERIRIGDLDGDTRNDILMFLPGPGSIVVRYQDESGRFGREQAYATGPGASDAMFFQDARRKYLNAAILSPAEGVLRLLHNRTQNASALEGLTYAAGNDPSDVEVVDLNADGWDDVIVTHESESVLSVFFNDGAGVLKGQRSYPLSVPASALVALSGRGDAADFLAPGADGRSISYLTIDGPDRPVSAMTVHTDGVMEPIDGRRRADESVRRIYALRASGRTGGAALLAFDLVDRIRHEEIDLRLDLPARILASSPHDFDGDGLMDLALLALPDTGPGWTLTVYHQNADGFTLLRATTVRINDPLPPAVTMWVADLNGDGADDLILNLRAPDESLIVILAEGDSAFSGASTIQKDVRIRTRKGLTVTDFDGDGRPDLVFANERTGTVQFLPGDGAGGFSGLVNLTGARDVGSFAIADLNHDREKELILTNMVEGVLSVNSFHHPMIQPRRTGRRE